MRSGATRTVRRLRLRAGSVASARRVLPRLEDALRTAALPDAAARLIIIRRWDLGRLPADVAPQTLSLMIESRFAAAGWTVAHAAEAGADAAPAVWFRDALEAHEIAACRLVAGRRLDAWFWPLALPTIAGVPTPDEQMRALAFSVATLDEAAVALPHWGKTVVAAGGASQLARALTRADGRTLLRAASPEPFASRSALRRASHAAPAAPTADARSAGEASRPSLAQGQDGGRSAADDRLELLARWSVPDRRETPVGSATATAVPADGSSQPARPAPRHAPGPDVRRAASWEPAIGTQTSTGPRSHTPDTASRESAARSSSGWRGRPSEPTSPPVPAPGPPRGVGSARSPSSAREPAAPGTLPGTRVSDLIRGERWAMVDRADTAAGGLLFLVPLLDRLAFGAWCHSAGFTDAASRSALSAGLFARLLVRLKMPSEDPTWALVHALCDGDTGRLDAPHVGTAASHWLRVCRTGLGRASRMGLASLVRRQARLAITPTHVDTFLSLDSADVRIRRAGLDIDPGWVPWLGRVVSFHYDR